MQRSNDDQVLTLTAARPPMNCHDVRKLFPLFYDSEGDAEVQLQIGDHLAFCTECKSWFEKASRHTSAMESLIGRGDVDVPMWARIEGLLKAGPQKAPKRKANRIFSRSMLVLAICLLAALIWPLVFSNEQEQPVLSHLAATQHARYLAGESPMGVASDSVEQVEEWLTQNVGFRVRCPPKGQGGFNLRGGGVCRLSTETAAHIIGDVNGRTVSLLVLRGESLKAFPDMNRRLATEGATHNCREGEFQMVASRLDGHLVIVLGESSSSVLNAILAGYGAQHPLNQVQARPAPAHRAAGSSAVRVFIVVATAKPPPIARRALHRRQFKDPPFAATV